MGLKSNEKVDTLAKNTLSDPPAVRLNIPVSDFKSLTRRFIYQEWNNMLSIPDNLHNKLFYINPTLTTSTHPLPNRRNNVVLTRLRLGHIKLSYAHIIGRTLANLCPNYGIPFTVWHILMDCRTLASARLQFYKACNLYNLFKYIPALWIWIFVKPRRYIQVVVKYIMIFLVCLSSSIIFLMYLYLSLIFYFFKLFLIFILFYHRHFPFFIYFVGFCGGLQSIFIVERDP